MKQIFTLIAIFISTIVNAQNVFVYVTGENDGSAYTRVELNDITLGTLGVNEIVISDLDREFNTISFYRRGYNSRHYTFDSVSNDVFIEVAIGKNKIWKVTEVSYEELPNFFKSKLKEHTTSKADKKIDRIENLYNGVLPKEGSTILPIVNANYDCSSSNPDIIYSYINAVFIEKYRLINRGELNTLIEEQKLSLSGLISYNESVEAGNLIGAKYSLLIDYQCEEGSSKLDLTLNLINCETSQIEWVGIIQKNKPAEIISDLSKLLEND